MGRIRARALEQSGRARVAGVCDPYMSSQQEYEVFQDVDSILAQPDIDAVFVCTPNRYIAPTCIAALEAGKHVFSEKPPAFNAAGVEEVMEAEARSGKILMYGFNHRHHPSIQRMKSIIEEGGIGRVLWMRGRYGKEVNSDYFKGWRANKELAGGGILLDQGIHMLDLFMYLGTEFDEIQAMVSNLFWKIEGIEDNVFAQFRCSRTGMCASLHSTMTQWRYLFSLEVFLEGGALILNGLRTSSGVYGDEELAIKYNNIDPRQGRFESEERYVYHTDTSWDSEIEHFVNAVEGKAPVTLGSSTDALRLMRIMDRIYGQART